MVRGHCPQYLTDCAVFSILGHMTARREARQLAKKAEQQGWVIDLTKGGHLRYKAPNGKILFFSSTPSDARSLKNQVSLMSKNGFVK